VTHDELLPLLMRARAVLDRHMFDSDECLRDDIAEVCMAIDEALPDADRVSIKRTELELDRRKSAA
jgi:hypothetical protein